MRIGAGSSGHSLARLCQRCRHPSHYQPATTFNHHWVSSSHFLWASSLLSEWMKVRMLSGLSSGLLRRVGVPPWRPRPTLMKNIHDDLSSLDLGIHEARDLAQNRPFCTALRTRSGAIGVIYYYTNNITLLVSEKSPASCSSPFLSNWTPWRLHS